jgi:hypothetical protein
LIVILKLAFTIHVFFLAFQAVFLNSRGVFQSSCPSGMSLLSCGLDNTQKNDEEVYRSAKPISSTTCECYDYWGASCVALCTNVPINNFEIKNIGGSGTFTATCPVGKKVLGCHIDPGNKNEDWRRWIPSADGTKCTCYDYFGANCVASCASNINNYEVVSIKGSGFISVGCTKPNNAILGCGSNPDGAPQKERWRTTFGQSGSCVCYDAFGTVCYAVCGTIW